MKYYFTFVKFLGNIPLKSKGGLFMKNCDKIDLIAKKSDIIYKKMIILLAASGGSGSYAIRQDGLLSVISFILFSIFIMGLVINYFELNKMKKDLEEIENG